ncbi:acetyl-CoA carboxylase, biotin carboxyl carrier protein [Gloeomargarita lithophora Alchichica-D10]|uniref:Biotin carboxyl carrier protein of acetyl-CoA carboxylase n=1 Tax=Gloeomargarita lithophora Alchichica-D10 TaxID=1188229 RepID=A0A1J0A935_9CYAN|nr:acetyl-CoA carboxylase biotin carboxyl carrier protein [Gloeomargarita lithophora]APB32417.1 acetyl-CoA carboxylase, biotin carboxyl carrier protein [Gloeomargarita lithophora Alchichica-D10]
MELNFQQLQELLLTLQQTGITTFSLKSNAFELTLEQGQVLVTPSLNPAIVPTVTPAEKPISEPTKETKKGLEVTSMMVGTFYGAPAPGEPPFVQVGDRVRLGQTLCIVEAMKTMNEIEAPASGEISEILVENGQPIEFEQVLMRLRPE